MGMRMIPRPVFRPAVDETLLEYTPITGEMRSSSPRLSIDLIEESWITCGDGRTFSEYYADAHEPRAPTYRITDSEVFLCK